MVHKSCFLRLVCLFGLTAVPLMRADYFNVNVQNCADFAKNFLARHAEPNDSQGTHKHRYNGRSYKDAGEFAQELKAVGAKRVHRPNSAAFLRICALEAGLLFGAGGLMEGAAYHLRFLESINKKHLACYALLACAAYGLAKWADRLDQTPVERIFATACPYCLCKNVLLDPNVINVLSDAEIRELIALIAKNK